ncbi:MAG: AAA domain-containing protein, partial [Defluviitaleaceae bacterium]|nr:AAA domain-containing protein [Defluviitaleaceae bacterium]
EIWAEEEKYRRKKDGDFPKINTSTALMNSFYTGEILKVAESPTELISAYGQAFIEEKRERYEIDVDVNIMEKWLKAEKFPLGTWPSKHSPSLMQQLAINLSVSNEKMIAVNGPPGTGKTTLLKEVIASNIVERALLLSQYEKPDDAFKEEKFNEPPEKCDSTYYVPDGKLTTYGIIVASNNNAAVENISLELPKKIDTDRSGLFVNSNDFDNAYFGDVATELIGQPAWGLISAKLGKSENIKDFLCKVLPAKTEKYGLMKYFNKDYPKPDWNIACNSFKAAYEKVQEAREGIAYAQTLQAKTEEVLKTIEDARNKLSQLVHKHSAIQQFLINKKDELSVLESDCTRLSENISIIQCNLPFLIKIFPIFFKKNKKLQDLQKLKNNQSEMVVLIEDVAAEIRGTEITSKNLEEEVKVFKSKISDSEELYKKIQIELEECKEKFGDNFVDEHFWKDTATNEKTQTSCPWTYYEYDKKREELFYQALMLHKAFATNSNAVKQNLMRLAKMWDGEFAEKDHKLAFSSLFNTLQLVVPVISTSFASVRTFLANADQEELGILVVDEAGQATPQSAVGAILRTRKSIIVGDPLQVEPILTTPKVLMRHFAEKNNVPQDYRSSELSVQVLADAQTPYGGKRKSAEDEEIWIGCPLIVHRRCVNPMFDISNQAAYNGRMMLATRSPDMDRSFLLNESCWYDIKGKAKGNKDHSVKEQTEIVCQMIKKAMTVYNGLPSVYVITPFTTVKNPLQRELRKVLLADMPDIEDREKKIDKWLKGHCGTIHTFQGKEADEVILVLGCDEVSGEGASKWVGRKPNIINVAVSRAKYRLAIVGDRSLWGKVNFVKDICNRDDIKVKTYFAAE